MIGLGTLINTVAVIGGGVIGHFFGKLLDERKAEGLSRTCGISVLFIGIAGAMNGMLKINGQKLETALSMMVVCSLVLGTIIGEIMDIERGFERFGEWLKQKTGNAKDKNFVEAFVNASLTICIGAMSIVGAIQDGIYGDWSLLGVKSVLDFIIIVIMTGSVGKGAVFSFIPILILEGGMTLCAGFLQPVLNSLAMDYLSVVGSILIFCVGVNLVWGKTVRVANMLPGLIFAVIAAYLPIFD
ncbi:MAG: DUF554 domain-containing protein [Acetatifactor sp.]|nr:DUF554 domain-containing protein [Acetatifactor sp.]